MKTSTSILYSYCFIRYFNSNKTQNLYICTSVLNYKCALGDVCFKMSNVSWTMKSLEVGRESTLCQETEVKWQLTCIPGVFYPPSGMALNPNQLTLKVFFFFNYLDLGYPICSHQPHVAIFFFF